MGVLPNNSITQDSLVKSSQRSVLLCYLSRYLLLLLLSQKPKLRLLLPLKLTPIQVRGMVMEAMAWAMDMMAMDIMAEKRGPLKQSQKQKPAQMLGMDTEDMVDIMVATTAEVMATHMGDTAMDTMAEKSDPLRLKLNQKLMLVQMLGMDIEATDTDIHTDTDTDVTMDTVVMATHMDTTDTTVKCHAIETVPAKTTLPSSL